MASDAIPVVSQAKSAVQALCGDMAGARETQENFSRRCVFVAPARAAYETKSGRKDEAAKTYAEMRESLDEASNAMPVVGHVKGAMHYAKFQGKKGSRAMGQATRSTAVLTSGLVGGAVAGPVAGAAAALSTALAWDAVDGARQGRPAGLYAVGLKAYRDKKPGDVFDAAFAVASTAYAGSRARRLRFKDVSIDDGNRGKKGDAERKQDESESEEEDEAEGAEEHARGGESAKGEKPAKEKERNLLANAGASLSQSKGAQVLKDTVKSLKKLASKSHAGAPPAPPDANLAAAPYAASAGGYQAMHMLPPPVHTTHSEVTQSMAPVPGWQSVPYAAQSAPFTVQPAPYAAQSSPYPAQCTPRQDPATYYASAVNTTYYNQAAPGYQGVYAYPQYHHAYSATQQVQYIYGGGTTGVHVVQHAVQYQQMHPGYHAGHYAYAPGAQ